jgi:hypothetical protein
MGKPSNIGKRGPKKGTAYKKAKSRHFWHGLCYSTKRTNYPDMTDKGFLESPHLGGQMTGTQSEGVSFGKWLKQYDYGSLEAKSFTGRKILGSSLR